MRACLSLWISLIKILGSSDLMGKLINQIIFCRCTRIEFIITLVELFILHSNGKTIVLAMKDLIYRLRICPCYMRIDYGL